MYLKQMFPPGRGADQGSDRDRISSKLAMTNSMMGGDTDEKLVRADLGKGTGRVLKVIYILAEASGECRITLNIR